MRRIAILLFWSFLALPFPAMAAPLAAAGTVEVYFSPNGGAEAAVVRELDGARSEILIQAYSFTNRNIARAIVDAKKRGVRVEAILDKSNVTGKYSAATFLSHAGVPVRIDAAHAIAHNKIIIVDRAILITGSFNFSRAAEEKNAENLLVLAGNQPLIERFFANYNLHREHSHPFLEGR